MNIARAMAKMANLPRILSAAQVLHDAGLITEAPNEVVKRYVLANPEINEMLARQHVLGAHEA